MDTLIIISKAVICITAVILIVLVMLQKPKDGSAGAAFGQESAAATKMRSQSREGRLDFFTKIGIAVFATLSFALLIIQRIAA